MCQALFSFNPYLSPRKAYEMHVISILDGVTEAHWFSQLGSVRATIQTQVVCLWQPRTHVKEKS